MQIYPINDKIVKNAISFNDQRSTYDFSSSHIGNVYIEIHL